MATKTFTVRREWIVDTEFTIEAEDLEHAQYWLSELAYSDPTETEIKNAIWSIRDEWIQEMYDE